MVSRPLGIALAAALYCPLISAQSGTALVDRTKSAITGAPQPTAPVLSTEARGDIMMARKMYREAIETFEQEPNKTAMLYNKIGIAYHQLQQLENAKKFYERALKMKRDYAEAYNNLGTVYYAKKSYRRAIGYYEK